MAQVSLGSGRLATGEPLGLGDVDSLGIGDVTALVVGDVEEVACWPPQPTSARVAKTITAFALTATESSGTWSSLCGA